MLAVVSDIHGNLEAIQAVLADIRRHPVTEIYCLGDTVGYGGPNPRECLGLAMAWPVVLLGNHDFAVGSDPINYGPPAYRAIRWAAAQLDVPLPNHQAAVIRRHFLSLLPRMHRANGFLFVHGSARNPLNEYVFPEDIYNQRKMERIFALVERYCFHGHTHIPGIFTADMNFLAPEEIDYCYRLDGRKTLCNVGSVGQPRDGDWRACYVLLDGDTIRYRRVEYDIETTIRKIRDNDDLDDFMGDRLGDGR
jgi:diadenosine tetraphosphatase ApaH/serine/threonine PP2A family protein phosphatase